MRSTMATSLTAIPIAAVMFSVWAVYLGGLAALQAECADNGTTNLAGTPGIDATLPCHKVYRLYWFYASWEIVVIIIIAVAAVVGKVAHLRAAFVGLLAVATILFIQASNTFLSAEEQDYYTSGQPLHRIRTITAGAIMTALMNAIAILVLGHSEHVVTTTTTHHHTDKPLSEVTVQQQTA